MERHDLLITTDELMSRLDDPGVRVLDVRHGLDDREEGRRSYEQAHIPGAVHLHWLDDWSDPDDPVEGQLAPPERFAAAMRAAGVDDDTLVVAYDDCEIFMAARMVWALHVYGHPQVRALDGGFAKWVREARPTAAGAAADIPQGGFTVRQPDTRLRLTKQDMMRLVDQGDATILDCRMDRTWEDSGAHIPGAGRLPSPTLVGGDGTLRSPEELAAQALAQGADRDAPVHLYCGGGVSASEGWLALRSAGFEDVRVYDGSWSEWSADPDTPKEPHGVGGAGGTPV